MAERISATLLNDCLSEVTERIHASAPGTAVSGLGSMQEYIGTKHPVLGLDASTQRDISKQGFRFSSLSPDDQLPVWDYIWNNGSNYEVMSQALLFLENRIKKLETQTGWSVTREWVKRIDNWAHSDSLSKCYCFWLHRNTGMVFPQLQHWNNSKNPWERRQSIVSLIRITPKAGTGPELTAMLPLIENLLDDADYFVQKGIGWALRDLGTVYPEDIYRFLHRHYARISGTAFGAAAEKLTPEQKEKLKELRKTARKK